MAYSSLHAPFDSGLTYAKFFADPAAVAGFVRDYRQPQKRPAFIPSGGPNWEAQHPPLYYLMLAPVLRLVETAPLVSQILVLRIVSYLLAITGVFFGLRALSNTVPKTIPMSGAITDPAVAATGFILYPVMLPMFFPEFARIGNDSLCLLLAGLAAFVLSKIFADERKLVWPFVLGACLGLGLLTKAFFLPITFAIGAFLLAQCWRSKDGKVRLLRLRNGAITLIIAILIGGGWYVYDAIANGVLIGGDDSVVRHTGFWTGVAHNLSVADLARGAIVTFITWIWAGTWSLVRMPLSLYVPLVLLAGLTIGAAAAQLRRAPLRDPLWLTVLLFVVFAAGLLYHVVLVAANGGEGGTAGWYFHILMPWTAPAMGLGIAALTKRPWARWLFAGLLGYAVLFQAIAVWSLFALFTGCAVKDADKYFSFPGHSFCLDQTATLFGRLAVIGWPVLAGIGFGGGLFCAAWLALRVHWRAQAIESTATCRAVVSKPL